MIGPLFLETALYARHATPIRIHAGTTTSAEDGV